MIPVGMASFTNTAHDGKGRDSLSPTVEVQVCPDIVEISVTQLKTECPCDTATPLLGICLQDSKSTHLEDSCMSMFTAVPFKAAKSWWDQPGCPSTDKWVKKI